MARASISRAWDDTTALLRQEGALIVPVVLALVVLPAVLADLFIGPAAPADGMGGGMSMANPVVLLPTLYASLALSLLALRPGISVAEALASAFRRLPVAIGASLLIGLAFAVAVLPVLLAGMGGPSTVQAMGPLAAMLLLLYIVGIGGCGIYVMVRLTLLNTVAANERLGVIATLRRSWLLTRGLAWPLLGFTLLFVVLSAVVVLAVTTAGGSLFIAIGMVTGAGVGRLLTALAGGLVNAAFLTWLYLMMASVYRQVSASGSSNGI